MSTTKKVALSVLAGVLIITGIWAIYGSNKQAQSIDSSVPYSAPDDSSVHDSLSSSSVDVAKIKERINTITTQSVDATNLGNQINSIINANKDIVFGIAIKDLKTGTTYNYGNSGPMTAASVSKVLTAVDYLKEVELGHKSLSTVMSNGYTAQYNMEQMIVVSDNNSWHLLNDSLGYTQMQEYAKSIGLSSYNSTNNTLSSADTAKLFGDLYERQLINESHSELLLSYMERANYRDLIIPVVPEHNLIFHKAGELYSNLNDAAIITNSSNAIVLSIYTESLHTYSKSRVASLMQQITTPTLQTFQLN